MVLLYSPLPKSESLVIIPWCYQHVISNLKAAVDQPGRLLWQNGLFYDILLWLMRPFPLFHTHLFQAWDSLSTTSPGSHHKTPAVVQLFTIEGNQQNQILGCCRSYVIWSFVFPFCMCVCVATTVHGIIQGHCTEAGRQKWSNKQFLPPSPGPRWCDYSEQKGMGLC